MSSNMLNVNHTQMEHLDTLLFFWVLEKTNIFWNCKFLLKTNKFESKLNVLKIKRMGFPILHFVKFEIFEDFEIILIFFWKMLLILKLLGTWLNFERLERKIKVVANNVRLVFGKARSVTCFLFFNTAQIPNKHMPHQRSLTDSLENALKTYVFQSFFLFSVPFRKQNRCTVDFSVPKLNLKEQNIQKGAARQPSMEHTKTHLHT